MDIPFEESPERREVYEDIALRPDITRFLATQAVVDPDRRVGSIRRIVDEVVEAFKPERAELIVTPVDREEHGRVAVVEDYLRAFVLNRQSTDYTQMIAENRTMAAIKRTADNLVGQAIPFNRAENLVLAVVDRLAPAGRTQPSVEGRQPGVGSPLNRSGR